MTKLNTLIEKISSFNFCILNRLTEYLLLKIDYTSEKEFSKKFNVVNINSYKCFI